MCYKNGGTRKNDLLIFINYIFRYYSHNNKFLGDIEHIAQKIIQQNKTTLNYKEYFELKHRITEPATYGMKGDLEKNYKIIPQGEEEGQENISKEHYTHKEKNQNKFNFVTQIIG